VSQDLNVRRFLMETKEKAEAVLADSHTGLEAKQVIRHLIEIATGLIELSDVSAGQSADARVIKRKMEQQRAEARVTETKVAAAKNAVIQLATQIEVIAIEAKKIRSRTVLADDPNAASVTKIDSSVATIAKTITEIASI
jgi:hypothetical protein